MEKRNDKRKINSILSILLCVALVWTPAVLPAKAYAGPKTGKAQESNRQTDSKKALKPAKEAGLTSLLDKFDHYLNKYEYTGYGDYDPPVLDTVSILDTDILDTDDIVAVERFAFCDNAYGIAACVQGGDEIIRGVLDSIGSSLPVAGSNSATGYSSFWELYRTDHTGNTQAEGYDADNEPVFEEGFGEEGGYSTDISALDMYKEALRNSKVDIITIGYLDNIYDLLTDPEGYELACANLNAVYITGGNLKGLGDCNFNTSGELLNMSIYVTDTLRSMGVYTVYLTNDLAGAINTAPYDSKSRQAFATLARDTTPSWDIFSVWVYKNRASNPHVKTVRSSLYIKPDSSNVFTDGVDYNSYRVVKVSSDTVIQGLI